jgi:predicted ABC-type ATPase
MTGRKQLWVLAGGNGAGKSTFFRMFLQSKGMKIINADMIAKDLSRETAEDISYKASQIAEHLRERFIDEGLSFCFETVFSHESKIDFVAKAKSLGYEVILVYIHLATSDLNEARVSQRVSEGGHDVPSDKIRKRIPRTVKNIKLILPVVDSAFLLDNSSTDDPFKQIAAIRLGRKRFISDNPPDWAKELLALIP